MDLTRTLRDRKHRWWLSRARAGHERAFRALYRDLYGPVRGYVSRRIPSSDDAEDVVSRVFHRWLAGLDRYDPDKGSVWTWVMTLARHAVVDHWRSRGTPHEAIDDLAQVIECTGDDPLQRLVREEDDRLLHGLLSEEPDEVREMFALHFADGLSYREIAEVLGLTESAVKQRFSRTLRRLRASRSEGRHVRRERGDEHERRIAAPTAAEDAARP